MNGLTPLLGRLEFKKKTRFVNVVSSMSGESSNCSKIMEIVNFFLKFPRVSKILFHV